MGVAERARVEWIVRTREARRIGVAMTIGATMVIRGRQEMTPYG